MQSMILAASLMLTAMAIGQVTQQDMLNARPTWQVGDEWIVRDWRTLVHRNKRGAPVRAGERPDDLSFRVARVAKARGMDCFEVVVTDNEDRGARELLYFTTDTVHLIQYTDVPVWPPHNFNIGPDKPSILQPDDPAFSRYVFPSFLQATNVSYNDSQYAYCQRVTPGPVDGSVQLTIDATTHTGAWLATATSVFQTNMPWAVSQVVVMKQGSTSTVRFHTEFIRRETPWTKRAARVERDLVKFTNMIASTRCTFPDLWPSKERMPGFADDMTNNWHKGIKDKALEKASARLAQNTNDMRALLVRISYSADILDFDQLCADATRLRKIVRQFGDDHGNKDDVKTWQLANRICAQLDCLCEACPTNVFSQEDMRTVPLVKEYLDRKKTGHDPPIMERYIIDLEKSGCLED